MVGPERSPPGEPPGDRAPKPATGYSPAHPDASPPVFLAGGLVSFISRGDIACNGESAPQRHQAALHRAPTMASFTAFAARANVNDNGRRALRLLDRVRPGQITSVRFTKRTTGETVTRNVIVTPAYLDRMYRVNLAERGLVPVFDVKAGTIKTIPANDILGVKAGGRSYVRRDVLAAKGRPAETSAERRAEMDRISALFDH